MKISNRTFNIARRTVALSAVLGASLVVAHAQQVSTPAAADATAQPTLNLQPVVAPAATFSFSKRNPHHNTRYAESFSARRR